MRIEEALAQSHATRAIFRESGVRPNWFFASSATRTRPLFTPHPGVWSTEWPLFIHHRITAHHRRQAAMETFKPLQCPGANAPY